MPNDLNEQLRTLLAKEEIREVILRYGRGFDRFDRTLVESVWHPGGWAEMGDHFSGDGLAFVAWCWPQHEGSDGMAHQMLSSLINVEGERASSETYVFVKIRMPKDGGFFDHEQFGRYLDEWSYRGGRWAIDRRRYIPEMMEQRDAPGATPSPFVRRGLEDPSYALDPPLTPARAVLSPVS